MDHEEGQSSKNDWSMMIYVNLKLSFNSTPALATLP